MKIKPFLQLLPAFIIGIVQCANAQGPSANRTLSNLTAPTSINTNLLPKANAISNLGSTSLRWKTVYLNNLIFPNGSIQATAFLPYTAGTGIGITGNVITNNLPDKVVTLTPGSGILISGSYPDFNISSALSSSPWISNSSFVYCNTGNIGIGIDTPSAKLEVAGGDALINGLTVGLGNGNINSNIAVGLQALYNNTTGFSNTVYGSKALFSNTAGCDNSAMGENALLSNVDGIENTALGNGTLYYNVSGYGNTAVGNGALLNNGIIPNSFGGPEGSYNSASGFFSLFNNTTGSYNAAFGTAALYNNTEGINNTAIGAYSDVAAENLNNAAAFGFNSIVNSSNKIRLGDVNVTIVESAAGSWTTSDGRFKTNIKEEVVGLPFIKLLRPVLYNFDANKFDAFLSRRFPESIKAKRKEALKKMNSKTSNIIQTGFIAQEVAEAAKKAGYNFNGVHVPENEADNYSLSYEKLVVPLVKAVQELSNENETLTSRLSNIEEMLNVGNSATAGLKIMILKDAVIKGAAGNSNQALFINYHFPGGSVKASIEIAGENGVPDKTIALLPQKEKGLLVLETSLFKNEAYTFSLIADDKMIDTKKIILNN